MTRRTQVVGTVYLIHLDRPFKHAKHYIGWTEGLVEDRLAAHQRGEGSAMLRAVKAAGIGFRVVRTWEGKTRDFERSLKKRHNAPRLCPCCKAGVPGV